MAAHQVPPSLAFSRQEHWSGLPFPSPMHKSEKWKWKWSCVRLLTTPWTVPLQAPPSMGFSRQEYWSGVPLPSLKKKARKWRIWSFPINFLWLSFSHYSCKDTYILKMRSLILPVENKRFSSSHFFKRYFIFLNLILFLNFPILY